MSLPIYTRTVAANNGDIVPGAEYTVIDEGTGLPADCFADRAGTVSKGTQPFFADSNGKIEFYFGSGLTIRVAAITGEGTATERYFPGVLFGDQSGETLTADIIGPGPSEIPLNSSILSASSDFLTYGGTSNAITLTTPYATKRTALIVGEALEFWATAANTGAATVKIDSLTTLTAKTPTGEALPANYILTDRPTRGYYDGTDFIVERHDWYELGGFAQNWEDVTGSRSFGVVYTNTTGRPIQVLIKVAAAAATSGLTESIFRIDGVIRGTKSDWVAHGAFYGGIIYSAVIPPNSTYEVINNSNSLIANWSELR